MKEKESNNDGPNMDGPAHSDEGSGEQVNAWSHVPEGGGDSSSTIDVAGVRLVVDRVLERRARGEWVTDAQVIAEHPECMPVLAQELAAMHEIHRAYLAAMRAGP